MKARCHIERYEPNGAREEYATDLDERSVVGVMESLRQAWSATLRITGKGQEMAVSFSIGAMAVMLTNGEDEFYDLVARDPCGGWVEFVHGGQPAEHPRRHVVSMSDVMAYVPEFLVRGAVLFPDSRWERHGESQIA